MKLQIYDFIMKGHTEYFVKADEAEVALAEERARVVRGEFMQICSYCGFETKKGEWEELQEHIKICDKHPLPKAKARINELEEENRCLKEKECTSATCEVFEENKELEEQLKAVKLITDKLSETYALNIRERICDTDIAFYVAQLRAALQDNAKK